MPLRPLVCLAVCAALLLLGSSAAQACTCEFRSIWIGWPKAGATDVARDAPLVVGAFELDRVATSLVAEDGTRIELVERRRLETSGECSNVPFAFLGPSRPLEPHTRYVFSARTAEPANLRPGELVPQIFEAAVDFVTGDELRNAPPPELDLHVFGADTALERLWEVYVETDAVEPLFASARGQTERLSRAWDPSRIEERPFHLSLGATACAEFTIVDVAGETVSSEQRCQPNKCTPTSSTSKDSCGGESVPAVAWTDWQGLPDGCDALASESLASESLDNRGGCGLAPLASGSAWPWATLCLAAHLARRTRRRQLTAPGAAETHARG